MPPTTASPSSYGRRSTIKRVTVLRVADLSGQNGLLQAYDALNLVHSRNGRPYILRIQASPAISDSHQTRGYTVVARVEFSSLDDMRFFEHECPAHKALKEEFYALGGLEKPFSFSYLSHF